MTHHGIRSTVWITAHTSHCRERLGGSQNESIRVDSQNSLFQNHDTPRIRSSVWFTVTTHMSHCREGLGAESLPRGTRSKVRLWRFNSPNLIFVENRDTLHNRSSLVFDSLRSRVTAEKDLVMLKKCMFKYTDLSFVENCVTPVSGVVCGLLRARVTAKKDSVMVKNCKSASLKV